MIPIIGIMIGAYIFTRMLDLIMDDSRKVGLIVKFFAALTILAAVAGMLLLITMGFGSTGAKWLSQ